MQKFFEYIGRKAGETLKKGKWVYSSIFGSEEEALRAEYFFGKQMAENILNQNSASESALLNNISSRLVDRLKTQHKFHFFLLKSDEPNAYALPGGWIFFTDSMLKVCSDENEIAFVLSHEIGHVIKRHSFNKLLADYSLSMIGKFLRVNGFLQNVIGDITQQFLSKKYSRENEYEADNFAVDLMKSAKYDVNSAIKFFEKLKAMEEKSEFFPDYFSTHPSTDKRIAAIKEKI